MEVLKRIDKRAFTSIGLLVASIILPVSIFLRHTPLADGSRETVHLFTEIHSTAGMIFVFFFIAHVIFNWKALKKYLGGERQTGSRKELYASVGSVLVILILFSAWGYLLE